MSNYVLKTTHKKSGRFYYAVTTQDKYISKTPYIGKGELFDRDMQEDGMYGFEVKIVFQTRNRQEAIAHQSKLVNTADKTLCYNHINKKKLKESRDYVNRAEFNEVMTEMLEIIQGLEHRIEELECWINY